MKFASTLLLLAPLVSAGLVPSRSYVMPFQPPIHPAMLRNVTDETVAPLLTKLLPRTNGQRMAHGLSPLPPRTFGRRTHLIKQRQNRIMHAARAGPSSIPVAGRIAALDHSGAFVGYLAQQYNQWGESGLTTDASAALHVTFAATSDGSAFDITATNPQASSLPYIGAIVGFGSSDDSMGVGNSNYAYLGGVTATPVGSSAMDQPNSFETATGMASDEESAIWTYSAATSSLVPIWVNPDESTVPVSLVYMTNEGTVCITGDVGALEAQFPSEPMQSITFTIQ